MAPAPFIVEVNTASRRTQNRGGLAVTKTSLVWLQRQGALPQRNNRLRLCRLEHMLAFASRIPSCSSVLPPSPASSQKALPNPSLKPSPNSKTPGPRSSACHHLQRGPGVFLSVPA
jgi:hypothetical protein